jgi:glycosyltransferase involved in cell wall biosynthesis
MRKTIALVAASLDILGGQGIQARAVAEHLTDAGYKVLFVPVNPRFPSWLEWVRRIPAVRTLINELLYLPSLARLRDAHVVHIFSASYWSFLLGPVAAILAGRILGKRIVLNYHSGEADDHLLHWGVLVHPWLRLVDEIVVPSKYLQNVFARHGYAARVIQNIVDTSALQYRERPTLTPRLLSTRNLERHYGVDVILKAFALIRREYPNATLTVAGYGREEQALRELARALGAAGIRFVGRQEPPAMAVLYGDADVFVNASVVDNQPVSVLEAFAAGVPVVSTSTGDIQNLIGVNECGLIVPADDPPAMAAAVISLISHPERALQISRCARRNVETFTWPHVCDAWRAVYERSAPSPGVTGREAYVAEPR